MRSLTGMYDLVRIAKLRPKFLNPKKQANMPETLEKRLAEICFRVVFHREALQKPGRLEWRIKADPTKKLLHSIIEIGERK